MTAFDTIIAIVIGSLLSRAITSKDSFFKVMTATVFLILLHRLFSFIAAYSDWFGNMLKGQVRVIVKNGEIKWHTLKNSNLSEQDMMQLLRLNVKTTNMSKIKEACLRAQWRH